MSSQLKFYKETTLPATLQADSFYAIEVPGAGNEDFAEFYVTDTAGVAHGIGTQAWIASVVAGLSQSEVQLAADIAARDALTLSANSIVLVTDATGDATVGAGAAMYFYDAVAGTYIKVTEFESLDVALDWGNIVNGPASTAAAIDAAVTNSHTHANKAELDKVTEDVNGCMLYDGVFPDYWTTAAW